MRPASSETRRPVSSKVEITTFSIPERQAFMSRSAFSFVKGSRLYWYLAIVRILHNMRTVGALHEVRSDGGVTEVKGGVRFHGGKANGLSLDSCVLNFR